MEDTTVTEILLGIIILAVGWWVGMLTNRVVDMSERLAHMEGKEAERERQEAKAN